MYLFFKFYWSIVALWRNLISAVQQSKSAICTHIYPFLFRFPYHLGHQRAPSSVPWAVRSFSLVICLISTRLCSTLCGPLDCSPPGSSVHGSFQARNPGMGCHFLLQGIFPTQGSNLRLLCLLHCRWILYQLCHWGCPSILYIVSVVKVKVAQLYPELSLCNPRACTVHRILQARVLEWVAIPFSRGSSQPRDFNPGLSHCRQILYQLSHQRSPAHER